MTNGKLIFLVAALGFALGAAAMFTLADYSMSRYVREQWVTSFQANAAQAEADLRELEALRDGQTAKAIERIETRLDTTTAALSIYEDVVPGPQRIDYIYKVASEIKAYRASYPSSPDWPGLKRKLERTFALGGKYKGG